MSRKLPIFYSALLLTAVNLFLRFAGTSFQVYLSGRIGAEGIGLLQLVMSVGSFSMIAGIAGIRTATMYLTAEEIGKQRTHNIPWILSSCFLYSILCSGFISFCLYLLAPVLASHWICNSQAAIALRVFAACLPVSCLCSVMTGYFTAANKIGTLAAVEVAEQITSMMISMYLLTVWGKGDAIRACISLILGSFTGSVLTLVCLIHLHQRGQIHPGTAIDVFPRIKTTAVPLAFADILRSGISTVENLIVPKRLALNTHVANPLAVFGTVCGMVFPVLMFPACILFGLAELLIPELSRCNAASKSIRIRYLVQRSLKITLLYGLFISGLLYLFAENLCTAFYDSKDAGIYLKKYALLAPMLYCDIIVDSMIKGLGKQKRSVFYNILTSTIDVAMLFVLLPDYGMDGYFLSFLISHVINFILSLTLLLKISQSTITVQIPLYSILSTLLSLSACSFFDNIISRITVYILLIFSLLSILDVVRKEDIQWMKSIISKEKNFVPAT